MQMKAPTIPLIVVIILGLSVGGCCLNRHYDISEVRAIHQSGGKLTNPLLDFEVIKEVKNEKVIRGKLEKLIAERIRSGKVQHVSLYFRDLNNGPWFGINDKELFVPASLLKVPIMMHLMKTAEHNRDILQQKIVYAGDNLPGSETTMNKGEVYTVEDLIFRMIAWSDNHATLQLINFVGIENLDRTYTDLGLAPLSSSTDEYSMTVRNYASFFRILYNASYLSREMSEKALEYLSKSSFRTGIVAGVPQDIVVANKFGVREYEGSDVKQLHDCGIVYVPSHPYLLCIMTRGTDEDLLAATIRDLSRIVYESIDRQ